MMKTNVSGRGTKRKNTLDKILKGEHAKRAFNTLVGDKIDANQLKSLLWMVAALPKKKQPWVLAPRRRELDRLRKKTLDLASQIKLANRYSGPFMELFQFVTTKALADPEDPFSNLMRLPRLLRKYARILDIVRSKSLPPKNQPSPQNQAIDILLRVIRESTGKSHYEEIAVLLNAVDQAIGYIDEHRWDAGDLAIRAYREREHVKKLSRSS
jgi:hypothetical protein